MKSNINKKIAGIEIVNGLVWACILLTSNLVSASENYTLFFNILIVGAGIQFSLLSSVLGKFRSTKEETA
ncbi:MAG: hypothetical protein JXQ96_11290 [Cyclobacteriaceae bacterium]